METAREKSRLEALSEFDILDTLPEKEFDDIVKLAAVICGAPIALISLVDETRQWFKARVGLDASETPRSIAFCAHAIQGSEMLVVEDARADARFANNPLVTGDPHIRFYAGVPLIDPAGNALGTLCVADRNTRVLTPEQSDALRTLAGHVMELLRSRRQRLEALEVYRREEQLRHLIDGSTDVIYEADVQGKFTFVNAATLSLLGYQPKDLVGRHFTDLIRPDWRERTLDYYRTQNKLRTATTYFEFPVITAGGSEVWMGQRVEAVVSENKVTGFRAIARDVTERRRAETERALAEARFEAFMKNSPIVAFIKDVAGRYVYANEHMSKLFGIPSVAIGGVPMESRLNPEEKEANRRTDETVLRTGEAVQNIQTVTTADGKARQWLSTRFPIPSPDGSVYLGGVAMDLTDRLSLENDLAAARDAALDSARQKARFLANMSHEIRTPMNGVIGLLGVLLDSDLTDDQRDLAQTARFSAEALLTIINDILDFSKIEAGKMTFETLDFKVRPVVESVIDLLADAAHQKSLDVGVVIDPLIPEVLRGDAGRLRQVLLNLLGNAIKFTPSGGVLVQVECENTTSDNVSIRFRIVDTGIGMTAETRDQLFQPFVQAEGTSSRRFGGTGLGLAISKQLVHLMNGEVGVESEPGCGSTFWFTATFGQSATVPGEASLAPATIPRVLVVDDSMTSRSVIAMQLTAWGVPNGTADASATALMMLREAAGAGDPFDIIISDLHMPALDGVTLARLCRADKNFPAPRFILMSSRENVLDKNSIAALGIDRSLSKPLKQQQLFDAVFHDNLASTVEALKPGTATVEEKALTAEASQFRILIADDNAVNQKVGLRQLKKLGYAADAVGNGTEVLEALDRIPYDAVLMDCQMPEMDGYEATAEIRRRENGRSHLPVIALTANASKADHDRCLAAGMDDFVTKPVREHELAAALSRHLRADVPAPSSSAITSHAIDRTQLDDITGGDESFLHEIAVTFLDQCARQRQDLKAALDAGDPVAFSRAAHALKGSSLNIGANRLADACREAEADKNPPSPSRLRAIIAELSQVETELSRIIEPSSGLIAASRQ